MRTISRTCLLFISVDSQLSILQHAFYGTVLNRIRPNKCSNPHFFNLKMIVFDGTNTGFYSKFVLVFSLFCLVSHSLFFVFMWVLYKKITQYITLVVFNMFLSFLVVFIIENLQNALIWIVF